MDDRQDCDLTSEEDGAEALLARIAGLLGVEPSYFHRRHEPAPSRKASEAELAELLHLFHAIEDADLRRSALNLLRLLNDPNRGRPDA